MTLDVDTIREIVRSELPRAVLEDAEVRRAVWQVARDDFADKRESESHFDQLMAELRRDREEQGRKWDEQVQQWDEQNRKWDEQNRKWDEQNRKWDENQRVINRILEEIRALNRKHDSSIGALVARCEPAGGTVPLRPCEDTIPCSAHHEQSKRCVAAASAGDGSC